MTHKCEICKLEYDNEKAAIVCQDWCSTHDSCNFQIATTAINKNQAKEMPIESDERYRG